MTEIYLMNTSELTDAEISALSPFRRRKAEQFIQDRDRRLSLAAGVLLDRGLRKYGLREKNAVFAFGESGKPYLREYPNVHFNLSHSGEMANAVFSDREIGCDIEYIRPFDEDTASLVFTDDEMKWITSSENRDYAFTRLWTVKESIIKAKGGSADEMRNLSLSFNGDGIAPLQKNSYGVWKLITMEKERYLIAICEEDTDGEDEQRQRVFHQ